MDTYGDTAVMPADVQHGFYPATYHSSGLITPNVDLDYLSSPEWYSPWALGPAAQQQSWQMGSGNGVYRTDFDYPMQYQSMESTTRQASPPISPKMSLFTQTPAAPRAATIPSMRQKRKQSPDTMEYNKQEKKPRISHDSPSIMSNSNNSPRSSMSSPTATASLNTRAHYAVEKRYRSTLNERYAALARIVSQPETIEICRNEVPDWEVPFKLEVPEEGAEKHPGKRQSKTTTLSVAIETIEMLDRACARKAREFHELSRRLSAIAGSVPVPVTDHSAC